MLQKVCQAEQIAHAERLLPLCMYQPTPEKTKGWLVRYGNEPDLSLYLYIEDCSDGSCTPIGVIGMQERSGGSAEIRHIAIAPEKRGQGIGRSIIHDIVKHCGYNELSAQTDKDAVDFYRACGFQSESLGMLYPGTERFRCTWNPDGQ